MKQKEQHLKGSKKYTVAVCIGVFTDEWCEHNTFNVCINALSTVVAKSYFRCI